MKKSEVWICDLPEGKGHEQKGERPAIVLARTNHMLLLVPLTSNLDRLNFSFTELIEQTPHNGLSCDSIALVYQLSSQDESRAIRKIGVISKEKQEAIDKLILEMFKISAQK
ncbi:type II toxin-antitoxin system PemK/MazF family toxin [Candidatus Micrarchaeota archaeon]|nr:type II toxin-antitoxin system PemK/MazF family toxin [Candidatus Micrarchaeota archaeon]